MQEKLIIGIDYGTDSCRAIIVDTHSGKELTSHIQLSVSEYRRHFQRCHKMIINKMNYFNGTLVYYQYK